jgi:O-antigen ligase
MNGLSKIQRWSQQAALYCALGFSFFIPISPALMNIFLFFTLVFTLFAGNLRNHLQIIWDNPVAKAALLLFSLFAVGTTWSITGFTESMKGLNKYNELWFIALLMPLFLTEERKKLAINTFLLSMILILMVVYAIYFGLLTELHIPITKEHTTIISVDNGFRSHIITNILMSFTLFIFAQRTLLHKKPFRWGYGLLFLFSAYYALFISTGTTGQILTIGLLSLLAIQHFPRKSFLIIPLLFSGIIGYGQYSTETSIQHAVNKIIGGIQHDGGSASQRREFIENSILLFEKRPWLGSGTGSIGRAYAQLPAETIRTDLTTNPHNEYVATGIQLGLLGFTGLILLFLIQAWQSTQLTENREQRYLAQGLVALIIVASLGNSMLMDSGEGHFWAFFSALLFTQPNHKV